MNSPDRDHLLLEFLDGTASPSDRSKVEAMLESSAEWRERYTALAGLFHELARVERATPPADLRDRVLEGIGRVERGRRAAEAKSRTNWVYWLTHLGPRPRVLVAASFAFGLVLGVVAMGPALHALRGDLGVLGTMGGAPAAPVKLSTGNARIFAWAGRNDQGLTVTVEVSLPEGSTAEIIDPAGAWTPVGLHRQTGSAGGLQVEGRRATWSGPTRGRFVVDFTGTPGPSSSLELTLTTAAGSSRAVLPVGGGPNP